MNYVTIKNWRKYQHYKDRNPKWIKLYGSTLDDDAFEELDDLSKLHLLMLWMIASRKQGARLKADEKYLTRKAGLRGQIRLKPLIDAGFLVCEQDASADVDECVRDARPLEEESRERVERETEESIIVIIPLRDGTHHSVTEQDAAGLRKAFPAVDIEAELEKCRSWNEGSPYRRKTRNGIKRHINTWMDSANEKIMKSKPADGWAARMAAEEAER
jgi:hypothetical protein